MSGGLLHVAYGALGGTLRCGSGGTPVGSFAEGRVSDVAGVGNALRQLLARSEIQESRALVAASDTLATFRVLSLPASTPDSNVESVVAKEFPLDDERLAMKWVDVQRNSQDRTVFAAAWDRAQLRAVTEAVRAAGLEPAVVDLKSACLARTVAYTSCILVDLSVAPVEVVLIDEHMPQLWQRIDSGVTFEHPSHALIDPLRALARYAKRRNSAFSSDAPVLISSDQPPSPGAVSQLARALRRPVEALPIPPRVPDIRYATYLTCLGLLMRRT
jgi:hypothetical protein